MSDGKDDKIREILEKPIHISKVFINGLRRTKDDFAKDVSGAFFEAKTLGQFFEQAQEVQQTFKTLGVTKGCQVKLDVGGDDGGLNVHLKLHETDRLRGSVYSDAGNDPDAQMGFNGSLKLTGRYLNLLGRGEQASCVFTKGITDGGRELIFHKPLRPGYGSTITSTVFDDGAQVALSGYKERSSGVSLGLTVPTDTFNHMLSWRGVWRQLSALNDKTAFAVREQAGHSLKSSVQYQLRQDSRDDQLLPTKGHLVKLTQELAGLGGNAHFYSKELSVQLNQQLIDRVVVQVGASVGHVQPLNLFSLSKPQPLSIMDKFYLGGPQSLRGFEYKGIGPRQQENALGSDFHWRAGAHLLLPLPGVRGGILDRFRTQLFVNAGNAQQWSSESTMSERVKLHRDTTRLTYGVGLVTNFLGIVKLELNYCIPAWHQSQDKVHPGFQFGISVGD